MVLETRTKGASPKAVSVKRTNLYNFRFPEKLSAFLTALLYGKYSLHATSGKMQTHGGESACRPAPESTALVLPGMRVSKPRPPGVGASYSGQALPACLPDSGPHTTRWLLGSLLVPLDANWRRDQIRQIAAWGCHKGASEELSLPGGGGRGLKLPLSSPHPGFNFTIFVTHFGPPGIRDHVGQDGGPEQEKEETQLRMQNKTHGFTFISASGAGNSLARGNSNSTAVMIRAPRNTKMTENLAVKDRGLKALFSLPSNQLGRDWLFPGRISCFSPLTGPSVLPTPPREFRNVFPFIPKPSFPDRYQRDAFLFIPGNSKFRRMGIGSFYLCLCAVMIGKKRSSPAPQCCVLNQET